MIDKILLFPYWLTLKLRKLCYDKGWKKSSEAEVPTISVGNITVGGTGKTPHTEMILRLLLESDRWGYSNIAVLSRGYKRTSKGFQKVPWDAASADLYGDEPVQIAGKLPIVTVAVDKDRVEGCRFLCHPDELETSRKARRCLDKTIPRADIIVLDDAFQYRKLRPKVNIVLVDYNRPLHKDKLLPLGRLRDLPERAGDADILIVTKCPSYLDEWEKGKWAETLGVRSYSPVTCKGRSDSGREQTLLFTTVDYKPMAPVFEEADSRFTYAKRLILFTGIAKDNVLRSYLSDSYKIIRRFSFPDHHRFTGRDLRALGKAIKASPTALICTTEKDAARLKGNPKTTLEIKKRLFQVPIEVRFLTPEEKEIFVSTLLGAL